MYGVYTALFLPCSRRAARVATRPSTWPLASMTCHRLSTLFALGTNVRIDPVYQNAETGTLRLPKRLHSVRQIYWNVFMAFPRKAEPKSGTVRIYPDLTYNRKPQ